MSSHVRGLLFGLLILISALFLESCSGVRVMTPFWTNVPEPEPLTTEEIAANEIHGKLFEEQRYPSARTCARCHPDHFREWSVSPHAYAQLSPVFNAMHATIVKLTNGTFGDFCIRCHNPVGTNLNEPVFASNLYRHPASREGITCIVCHRVNRAYGKLSGRFDVNRGELFAPVYGPDGGARLAEVLADEEGKYGRIATKEGDTGSKIHTRAVRFFYQTRPGFCGTCHDVTLGNGFRLEEAFSEYKTSPASNRRVTCQDCHMGRVPGVASGYDTAPAAIINGVPTPARKRTNHMMAGPDYSIIHPGLYPHLSEEHIRLANMGEWLEFDHEAGWGEKEFEKSIRAMKKEERPEFPEPWDSARKRKKARRVLDKQFVLLEEYRQAQLAVLRAGYLIGDIDVQQADEGGIRFKVEVLNGTDGHNVPTGFIAERTLYLEVTVRDSEGTVIFRSGDTDPNGDVRDLHSLYVHNGDLPLDEHLFSLQSKFITRNVRGSEREQVLAVNHSIDPLPFLRPATFSSIITGRPAAARTHRKSIEPGGRRRGRYEVEASALTGKSPYRARIRMIAGMVPPNLVHEIKDVGFDYGMSAREVADRIVAGRQVLWEYDIALEK